MTQKPRSKGRAIAGFLLVLLFWLPTVASHTLGFIDPVNDQAIGFDFLQPSCGVYFCLSHGDCSSHSAGAVDGVMMTVDDIDEATALGSIAVNS